MDLFCYLCFMFAILYCLFLAAVWSPTEKGKPLGSLGCVFSCVFVTFQYGVLGQG